jgi:hypothetical protein
MRDTKGKQQGQYMEAIKPTQYGCNQTNMESNRDVTLKANQQNQYGYN